MLKLNLENLKNFVDENESKNMMSQIHLAHQMLLEKTGEGNDFLGWVDLPVNYDYEEFNLIIDTAEKIRQQADLLVVIGIGGSYLGSRAVIQALSPEFPQKTGNTEIVYAGQNLSSDYLNDLLKYMDEHEVAVNVISKSGTTTEPAIAFRIIKSYMENRYGRDEAAKRIYATTDKQRGALKKLAEQENYLSFVVPDDVGGRYSVLTAVGLLPIAVAGIDIKQLMAGAAAMRTNALDKDFARNLPLQYAYNRIALARKGFEIEILVNYESKLHYFNEWWKQLYGESEGKSGRGLFPSSCEFTTDLHSMGQYIQDGRRILFETVLDICNSHQQILVPTDEMNTDGLNYLADKELHFVNRKAMEATVIAHVEGAVPNMILSIETLDAFSLGSLIYFFEFACGISGYLNGVNPFDQPGVENYKKNMFILLGKPGYETK